MLTRTKSNSRGILKIILPLLAIVILQTETSLSQVVKTGPDVNEDKERIVTLGSDEIVNEDYFAFGDTVEINGTVNGDVYVAAKKVLIEGKINGDLLAAAGSVNISGNVLQDARIAAGKITITGNIQRNITIAGGSVELLDQGSVKGSVLAFGGDVLISAPVGSNVKVTAGELLISSSIDGNVEATAGDIRLTSKAKINGDFLYQSDEKASIDPGAVISGTVTKKDVPQFFEISPKKVYGIFFGTYIVTALINFGATLLIGLLLLYFYPAFMMRTANLLRAKTLSSLGVGFLAFILTPVLIILLMFTILGIPLAFIIAGIYIIYLYISRVFVIFWLGHSFVNRKSRTMRTGWSFLAGLIIFSLLTLIPVIGGIINFLSTVIGLGVLLFAKKELYAHLRQQNRI